jgi:hypothetical protein
MRLSWTSLDILDEESYCECASGMMLFTEIGKPTCGTKHGGNRLADGKSLSLNLYFLTDLSFLTRRKRYQRSQKEVSRLTLRVSKRPTVFLQLYSKSLSPLQRAFSNTGILIMVIEPNNKPQEVKSRLASQGG